MDTIFTEEERLTLQALRETIPAGLNPRQRKAHIAKKRAAAKRKMLKHGGSKGYKSMHTAEGAPPGGWGEMKKELQGIDTGTLSLMKGAISTKDPEGRQLIKMIDDIIKMRPAGRGAHW